MRETPKAKRAWVDYVELGPTRSIRDLLARYCAQSANGIAVPTVRFGTLAKWSQAHGWQQRLADIAETERQAVIARGIADKQNRIDALNDRWERMRRVIEARASANEDLTGGGTGLVVREVTYPPGGAQRERHEVDTGLLKELREHEKQAAQELGQWSEGKSDTLLKHIDLTKLSNEQLEKLANGDDPIKVLLGR